MKDVIVITLGTGLGSGVVVDGKLVYGSDGFAGEIGHTVYDPNGRQCGCGKKDVWKLTLLQQELNEPLWNYSQHLMKIVL